MKRRGAFSRLLGCNQALMGQGIGHDLGRSFWACTIGETHRFTYTKELGCCELGLLLGVSWVTQSPILTCPSAIETHRLVGLGLRTVLGWGAIRCPRPTPAKTRRFGLTGGVLLPFAWSFTECTPDLFQYHNNFNLLLIFYAFAPI